MDRRSLLAIALCFLIFYGWQKFYLEPRTAHPVQTTQEVSNAPQSQTQVAENPSALSPPSARTTRRLETTPEVRLTLPTQVGDAVVSSGPELFSNWSLKSYHVSLAPEAPSVSLQGVTNRLGEVSFAFDDPEFAYLNGVQGHLVKTSDGALWNYEDSKVTMTKELTASDSLPYMNLKVTADFKGKRPNSFFVSLSSQGLEKDKDPEAQDRQLMYWTNQAIERVHLKDNVELKGITTPVKWIAAQNRYFVMALINQGAVQPEGLIQPLGPSLAQASMRFPMTGSTVSVPLRVYFGPKEIDLMKSVEPTLNHTIDFGWFELFAYPLLSILRWLHQFVGNFGVAIIMLTLLLKVATYPLTYKSMKSMKEMAKLQPQLAKLREKYKDDRESLNREMMTLMKTHGYNPMAGCLPMIIQMPVFFALYRVLYGSIELFHAPFALWIHDLSAPDAFYVTPVLLSVTMFIQQKLTPNTATDPTQQKMMQFMPLIFGAFMLKLPSGLTLYMLTNALASIVQQLILNKKLDPGHAPIVVARAR